MTSEQVQAISNWMTQVTHTLITLPDVPHRQQVDLLDSLCAAKKTLGIEQSVGESE